MTQEQMADADWREAMKVMREWDSKLHDFAEVQTKTRLHMQRRLRARRRE